jgi:hypothetical protein
MSRLDDHVSAVQNRLALRMFISTLAWLSLVLAGVIWIAVLIDRIFQVHVPRPWTWIYAGMGAVVVGALAYAIYRRPSAREAAVPIDQKLGLKEKISTALFIRPSSDPFAQAAVKDAEQTAQQVVLKLNEHFPLTFPRPAIATCAIALAAVLSFHYIDPLNFFDRREKQQQAQIEQQKIDKARQNVEKALATVATMPPSLANNEAIQLAKADLTAMLKEPIKDADKANRTAVRALQDVQDAIKDQVKNSSKYAEAQNQAKMLRSMQRPMEGQGPVSDAHRAITESKFDEAVQDLEKLVENFDKMDKSDQQKATQQMQQLANQLQQMANNPAQQQKMQQQMQQMGMNQQQAQQAQQLMQQAAQGNQQAQQQLQQMAQQAMQQAGMNQQQQQQMQQMMQQMQAQANAMNQAQQMQQAAQAMAQAMQQAQQAGQQGQPQPGQQGQQNQQMAQAMQQMQQQLQQMQAQAQDAQQIAAAQQAAQQAAGECQGGMAGNNPNGKPGNAGGGWGNKIQGDPAMQNQRGGNGFAGPNQGGQAAGDRNYKEQAPFGVKPEMDPTQDDENGRNLAINLIKDTNPLKGKSNETLRDLATRAQQEQTDEIDQERVSRQAQNAVKEYFSSVAKDAPEQK